MAREGIATQGTEVFPFSCIRSWVGAALCTKGLAELVLLDICGMLRVEVTWGLLFATRNRKDTYSVKPFPLKSFLVI